ncbi:hypothetical protein PQR70_41060 [Paraburkholderia madseniana]
MPIIPGSITPIRDSIGKNTVLSVKVGHDVHEIVVPDDKLIISRK